MLLHLKVCCLVVACITHGLGHRNIALLLINRGADVNHRDAFGRTPLHKAAANGHPDCLQLLLQHGLISLTFPLFFCSTYALAIFLFFSVFF